MNNEIITNDIEIPNTPDILPDVVQPPDTEETSTPTIQELFRNFAEDDDIVEKAKLRLRNYWSEISNRSELEKIWDKNDEMYRIKPDASKDDKHRANEATGVFHISVNQLVSIGYKTFTDNPENYSYGYTGIIDDEAVNTIRARNAEILTQLLRKSMRDYSFKRNLKKSLYDVYKNGTTFIGVPWEKQIVDLTYRDKESGERKSKPFKKNLPKFEFTSLDSVWLDENIDTIDGQPMIAIHDSISWTKLLSDVKKNKIKLFEKEGDQSLHDKFEKFKETAVSTQYVNAKSDRMGNAERTFQERTRGLYKHWICWINLPINKDTGKWDEDGPEIRCRMRVLGDPESGDPIEIRENVFPGGIPLLVAHQTEDDIGMYPISLGEKVESYFDQICIGVDQLIDNRSKNNRRPIVRDPLRCDTDKYSFGHSEIIDCQGDPRTVLYEMQISDMTANIMNTIQYCELKVKEIMNTTDAVVGQAMGGRTSASEYMGAKAAATTPIFSDMASIEDALIGEYMRRFAFYIHTFMTLEDIVDQVGKIGAEFQFDLNDIYTVELHGVSEAMDKITKIQNLMQLFGMTQDASARAKIQLRLAKTMGLENPAELVPIPAKDQAIKAALWENNAMLIYGNWDEPEIGELHDVHLPIHRQALWQAERDENQNINLLRQHISMTEQLKKMEQSQAGGGGSFPITSGQSAAPPPSPGEEFGQNLSAQMGNINAGSPVPAMEEQAAPAGL